MLPPRSSSSSKPSKRSDDGGFGGFSLVVSFCVLLTLTLGEDTTLVVSVTMGGTKSSSSGGWWVVAVERGSASEAGSEGRRCVGKWGAGGLAAWALADSDSAWAGHWKTKTKRRSVRCFGVYFRTGFLFSDSQFIVRVGGDIDDFR
ncbi:hypothetical protein DFH08DRAFT_798574 [Mycena albidolilacea]|uniref:Uncharacterized protein n=1 Tax=Mycena albidolilacea TaxID=1033008 RepID=A0AAD7APD6_9AGAR|nr:hypothetical protein DFH08DRAFT_798574 [Mycena albidolilacea]